MDGGAISCLNQSPHCEESKVKDRTTLVGGTPLTTSVMEEEHGNRLKVSCCLNSMCLVNDQQTLSSFKIVTRVSHICTGGSDALT